MPPTTALFLWPDGHLHPTGQGGAGENQRLAERDIAATNLIEKKTKNRCAPISREVERFIIGEWKKLHWNAYGSACMI